MPKVKFLKCLRVFFILACGLNVYSAESIVEQYNMMSSNPDFIARVKMSQSAKDNLALIRISGNTFIISSSIINGFLIKNIFPEGAIKQEAQILYPEAFRPISILDLLYMYQPDHTQNILTKLTQAKDNLNRKIFEKVLQISLFAYAQGVLNKNTLIEDISNLVTYGDNSLGHQEFQTTKNETDNIKNTRLQILKKSIIDFLFKLRQYANDVAVIPSNCLQQNKESHHLSTDKEALTKLDTKVLRTKTSGRKIIIYGGDRSKQVGMLEFILSQIDIRLLKPLGAQLSEGAQAFISSHDYDQIISTKIEDISGWMISLFKIISSPWCGNLGGAAGNYMRAITHTEQMVDWLSKYFGDNILVKISGKAPCVKCSHYIQYAIMDSTCIRKNWDKKTIIGFNTGWRSGKIDDIKAYRYPIMVFNDPIGRISIRTFSPSSSYQEGVFDVNLPLGIGQSHCYAIENVDGVQGNEEETRYKGQLRIQPNGSIIQIAADRGAEQQPLLIPSYFLLPHAEMPYYGKLIGE